MKLNHIKQFFVLVNIFMQQKRNEIKIIRSNSGKT